MLGERTTDDIDNQLGKPEKNSVLVFLNGKQNFVEVNIT